MFYLGTWELGNLDSQLIKELIDYAHSIGIYSYDTAAVYGNGSVEKVIGSIGGNNLQVVTKIPAKSKPSLEENHNILDFYPLDYIDQQIHESLERLCCNKVHSLLLHNWCYGWESTYCKESIKILDHIRDLNVATNVGISLPNQYNGIIHSSDILNSIDTLECPYNAENLYIEQHIKNLKYNTKEIILRSFLQNNPTNDLQKLLQDKIGYCLENDLSFTIGSTNKKHIQDNWQIINNLSNKNI